MKLNLKCVVSGQARWVTVAESTRIGQLQLLALAEAGQPIDSSRAWEARNESGELLVISNTVANSDLQEGSIVYIDPQPGVGA